MDIWFDAYKSGWVISYDPRFYSFKFFRRISAITRLSERQLATRRVQVAAFQQLF